MFPTTLMPAPGAITKIEESFIWIEFQVVTTNNRFPRCCQMPSHPRCLSGARCPSLVNLLPITVISFQPRLRTGSEPEGEGSALSAIARLTAGNMAILRPDCSLVKLIIHLYIISVIYTMRKT
jgi:hypothetical protein